MKEGEISRILNVAEERWVKKKGMLRPALVSPVSPEQVDLDAIEKLFKDSRYSNVGLDRERSMKLVAEVRWLRAVVEKLSK